MTRLHHAGFWLAVAIGVGHGLLEAVYRQVCEPDVEPVVWLMVGSVEELDDLMADA